MGNGLVQTLNYRTQKYLSALLMLIREAAARTFGGGGLQQRRAPAAFLIQPQSIEKGISSHKARVNEY